MANNNTITETGWQTWLLSVVSGLLVIGIAATVHLQIKTAGQLADLNARLPDSLNARLATVEGDVERIDKTVDRIERIVERTNDPSS